MQYYRYTLPAYNLIPTRYTCPACGEKKCFNRYIDIETSLYLHESVGRCNREIKCGYHKKPRDFFVENGYLEKSNSIGPQGLVPLLRDSTRPVSYIPDAIYRQSLQQPQLNHLLTYLTDLFGPAVVGILIEKYRIGTYSHWEGATVFWQLDKEGKVRAGKIILYDSIKGKRIKEPYSHINWVHATEKLKDFNLSQCLFGEHLLNQDPAKPVAVVESEKTAIIASVYLPQFEWVAVGSLTNLTTARCQVLAGRKVVLFPDLNCREKWAEKAQGLSQIAHVKISDLLEQRATDKEREQGWDIADYLVQINYKQFGNAEQA